MAVDRSYAWRALRPAQPAHPSQGRLFQSSHGNSSPPATVLPQTWFRHATLPRPLRHRRGLIEAHARSRPKTHSPSFLPPTVGTRWASSLFPQQPPTPLSQIPLAWPNPGACNSIPYRLVWRAGIAPPAGASLSSAAFARGRALVTRPGAPFFSLPRPRPRDLAS